MKKNVVAVVLLVIFSLALGAADWTIKRLTNNSGFSEWANIAITGSNVYVVWGDRTPGNFEIYFKKSTDGGATWPITKRLTNNTGFSYRPAVAVSGSNVYVVWDDNTPVNTEIYFRRSADGGVTWEKQVRLTSNDGASWRPAVAASGANVYVVWQDETPGNHDIYLRKSGDNGETWQAEKRLVNNTGESKSPQIAAIASKVYVVWQDDTPGNNEIYLRKSVDNGNTWANAKRLTNNIGSSWGPSVAVSGTYVYVAWSDTTPGNTEIYLRRSANNASTWNNAQRLTNNSGSSDEVGVAADGTNVYIVWADDTPGNFDVFHLSSSDYGATWGSASQKTANSGESYGTAIAASDSTLGMVWDDDTTGDEEIYICYTSL